MPDDLAVWRVPLDRALEAALDSREPEASVTPERAPVRAAANPSGTFTPHPRYRAWLARCGVTSAPAALALAGEVVSGHADRHVVRLELRAGSSSRTAYLKREHVNSLRWRVKNWAAGFGWVSRCEREAATLSALEAAGLPGPQLLAHGTDAAGRAFLLVDELAGATDLPAFLRDHTDRGPLAERVGTALAELHAAGFATPDLAAKHLFVHDVGGRVSVIDWPSAPKRGRVREVDVVRWLGALHAGVASELAGAGERLRVLWAYRRACRRLGRAVPLRFGFMAKAVKAAAGRVAVKAKRPSPDASQRLVWVNGEAVVAVPEVAADLPSANVGEPFYPAEPTPTPPHGHRERITLPGGQSAVLVRFRTVDPVGRLVAAVRERPWRSPGAIAARVLFHLQRHGTPAPRLLAFGQRTTSPVAAESFVCAEMPPGVLALDAFLARPDTTPAQRAAVRAECERLLKYLHAAGLRPAVASPHDPLFVVTDDGTPSVSVGSPFAVRLAKRITRRQRAADLRRFVPPTGGNG